MDLGALKNAASADRPSERRTRKPTPAQEKLKEIALAETLEKLYRPENFRPVGKLYFNARYGITGYQGFLLTKDEEEVISASLAMLTEALWLWDPRLLALIIAGGNIGGIIAQKEISYSQAKKRAKAAQGVTA